ncbi:MAG: lipid-binding SYLF domain-containing protein [Gemmatimonadota bacterium]|nr:lipid-binding SYLF domain-containing protein [Gemmatimonadota bacterium]
MPATETNLGGSKKMITLRGMSAVLGLLVALAATKAEADSYDITIEVFKNAGESATFFDRSYAYAVFPTIGKAGFWVGGTYGTGKVYARGEAVGTSSIAGLSVGFQAGGQVYSMIVFLRDKAAFDEFTSGNFEFGAQASATAITASVSAQAGSTGAGASASATSTTAVTAETNWNHGMAIFTVAKGGLMYEAAIAGQKFSYDPLN